MAYYLKSHKRRLKNPPEVEVKTHATFYGYSRKNNSVLEYHGMYNTFNFEFIIKDENYDPEKVYNKNEKRHTVEMSREEVERVVKEFTEYLERNERKSA